MLFYLFLDFILFIAFNVIFLKYFFSTGLLFELFDIKVFNDHFLIRLRLLEVEFFLDVLNIKSFIRNFKFGVCNLSRLRPTGVQVFDN